MRKKYVCKNCGFNIKSDVKFCANCGTKFNMIINQHSNNQFIKKFDITPIMLPYQKSNIKITEIFTKGPDDYGELYVTLKYTVTNNTDKKWDFYETRCQIFTSSGAIVEDTSDSSELSISTGETANLEISFHSIKAHDLGTNPEKAHLILSFSTSEVIQQKLGDVKIPENPFEIAYIEPAKIDNILSLISGSIWKTEPDDQKNCSIEIKALIQNHTPRHIPKVKIFADITDTKGREVTDAGTSEEIKPAALTVISGCGYAKEKKLIGACAKIMISAYSPVAIGFEQLQLQIPNK